MIQNPLYPNLRQAGKRSQEASTTRVYAHDPVFSHLGSGKTYFIKTHGCQANEADSENIAGILEACGFSATGEITAADLIVINTCAVRENAENKVFGEIGRLKELKRDKPGLKVVIAGCMPQEETVVNRIIKTYRQVDVVIGTHNIDKLPVYLADTYSDGCRNVEVYSSQGEIIEGLPAARANRYKAWVNIMHGCDEFCTYCIVPYTRGKERSRSVATIIAEVEQLYQAGYMEVTLLGQNVNAYGQDRDDGITFAELLRRLNKIPIPRVRFTTSHPKDFSPELVDVLALGGNLMPAIHLPVQSGSDRILKAMNRKYTSAGYLELVDYIYERLPHISLTTDIIVGFPNESEGDFADTLSLVRRAKFEGAYTFIYSQRAGTPAATLTDDVPKAEKKRRLQLLNELVNHGFAAGNRRFLGAEVPVLVEGPSKTDPAYYTGYTPNNKLVNFPATREALGRIVSVKITEARTWSLKGEISR